MTLIAVKHVAQEVTHEYPPLATAKNLAEVVELRAIYCRKQFSVLAAQAEEVRQLSAQLATDIAGPIKAHVSRSRDNLREELSPKTNEGCGLG
jgi:hypothetical protein